MAVFSEPRGLPFRVIARMLLYFADSLFPADFSVEKIEPFLVSDRVQRRPVAPRQERAGFRFQSRRDHGVHARVDAGVQFGPRQVEQQV